MKGWNLTFCIHFEIDQIYIVGIVLRQFITELLALTDVISGTFSHLQCPWAGASVSH